MTPNVYEFVRALQLTGRTLDIGSYDVNGSVRDLFDDYTGVDMRRGANVHTVANSQALPFADATFDNVLNLECLEHDSRFWLSLDEMKRVVKPGGRLVITTRGIHFPKHDFPSDYWRFTAEALTSLLGGLQQVFAIDVPEEHGVFACAVRPRPAPPALTFKPSFVMLDPDVAKVFTTQESVNTALRALLSALPPEAIRSRAAGRR